MGTAKPSDVLERYDITDKKTLDISHLDIGDAEWDKDFDVTIRPLYSNYYRVGDRVVDTLGSVGTVVGVEYLGKSRRPIVWVEYDNNKGNPQPEIPETLTPLRVANKGIFKVIQSSLKRISSVQLNYPFLSKYASLRNSFVPSPDTRAHIFEVGLGNIKGEFYQKGKAYPVYLEDTVEKVVLAAIALKIPVVIDWQGLIVPPHIAYNVIRETQDLII